MLNVAAVAKIAVSPTRTMEQRGMGDGSNEEEVDDHTIGKEMTAMATTFVELCYGNLVLRISDPSMKHQARGLSSSDDDIDYNPTPSAGHNNHTQQSNRVKERGGERKDESRRGQLWQKGEGSTMTTMIPAPDNSEAPNNRPLLW
jgi:hypothetical protein